MKKISKIAIIFAISLLQLNSISFCDDIENEVIDVNAEIISTENKRNEEMQNTDQIKIPDINSRAYVVIDRNTNTILCGKNENEKRKMASTTKIMTATIIIENCNLNETIEISKKAANTGGSRLGLKQNDKITIKDLLYGLLLRSGNDAAVALAEYAGGSIEGFAEMMNSKAKELNLNNTHFETPHGLDSDNHYTTAYELATLANYALNNKTFKQIVGTKNYTITINGNPKNLTNTNELLGNLYGVYGIKTGFTNGANRCLVTACKRDNMDIICVVLGADTKKFRTQDSIKLINYVMNNFKQVNIEEIIDTKFKNWKNSNLYSFKINKGISQNIEIFSDKLDYPYVPIRKDYINSITVTINCKQQFNAPLHKNTEIGNISIAWNNKPQINLKIYNKNKIPKKKFYNYFTELISKYTEPLTYNNSF